MTQDWRDPAAAAAWDARDTASVPTRPEQLELLVTLLERHCPPEGTVLDLGYGSGKVEELIFSRLPSVRIVGVDNSQAMMRLAEGRLAPWADRFTAVAGDLADWTTFAVGLPACDAVIAVQSLHHLSAPAMREAYREASRLLLPGGIFLLVDRVKVADEAIFPLYLTLWRHLDRERGSTAAEQEGADFASHTLKLQRAGDLPVELEDHLAWLRGCGLHPAVLHAYGNRCLIGARKSR